MCLNLTVNGPSPLNLSGISATEPCLILASLIMDQKIEAAEWISLLTCILASGWLSPTTQPVESLIETKDRI